MDAIAQNARKIWPIAGVSLALGIVFDALFYGHMPGVSVFIFTALVLAGLAMLANRFGSRVRTDVLVLAGAALFFAAMTFVRAAGFLTFLNIVAVLYLLLLIAKTFGKSKGVGHFRVTDYLRPVLSLPLQFVRESWSALPLLARPGNRTIGSERQAAILRGVAITLPVLLVFLLLFISADAIFRNAVGTIFDFHINGELVFRFMLIMLLAAGFVGAFAYMFMPQVVEPTAEHQPPKRLGSTEMVILLSSVNGLFLLFILVQLTYLFGGQDQVLNGGITYAEYARKGFFELLAVALITFVLIWATHIWTARKSLLHTLQFKMLSGFLILQVGVIIVSALRRLALYEEAYGFTGSRFYGHAFIFWLIVAFLLLAYQIMREQQERYFAGALFASVLAFLAILNLVNPDAFVARQNISRYDKVKKVDAYHLAGLSDDAVPEVVAFVRTADPETAEIIATKLHRDYLSQRGQADHDWQSSHLSRNQARRAVKQNKTMIKEKMGSEESRDFGR